MKIYSIARILGRLSSRWLDKSYSYRKKAIDRLVQKSHLSNETTEALIDSLFKELTEPKLLKLLRSEFRDPLVLDGFRKDPTSGNWHRAAGPKLITHIFAGNVPNPAIISFILGMLVKSTNVGKVSRKDFGFLDIYLKSLKTIDKNLWQTNQLIKPSDRKLLTKFIKQSDLVVAYGNNETLREIKKEVPVVVSFFGYGHKISFGLYMKEVLTSKNVQVLAKKAAYDVWMADQRGCLSPVAIYVEKGGESSPLIFSQLTAKHLLNKGRWAVLYDEKVQSVPLVSGSKVIYVKAFKKIDEVCKVLKPLSEYLQAVALEAPANRRQEIASKLSELGVNRICRAGTMQNPPITWHHDGKLNLASWVTWADLED